MFLEFILFGVLHSNYLLCQDMRNRIDDLFDLLNQFIQSTPRITKTAAPEQQPQPAPADKGPSIKLVKFKRLQGPQFAAKSRESRVTDFSGSAISTKKNEQELPKTAVNVSGKKYIISNNPASSLFLYTAELMCDILLFEV
jgi:hypothetical protein